MAGWHRLIQIERGQSESLSSDSARSVHTGPSEPEAALLQGAYDEQKELLSDARQTLDTLIARAEKIVGYVADSEPVNLWQQWSAKLSTFKSDYDAAVARSSAHADKMARLKQIEEQLATHIRETGLLREQLRAITAAGSVYEKERNVWIELLRVRDELIQGQCASLTTSSAALIRANVKRNSDANQFVAGLRQNLTGSRLSGNRIEAIGEAIVSANDPGAQWFGILGDLEKLAEIDAEGESVVPRPETPFLSAAGLTSTDLERIARHLTPETWLVLSLTPIASVPIFEYRARESDYIPFGNASAGQQATALLKTLLNQPGPPLIIDQPEEDLDNPVMLEVVEQLWKAKQKRQIIFTSHNANLVVNGDAELVAWCDYRTSGDQSRGTVAGEGAIDVPSVREAIERIMEGGKAAFNLRREKYGF
jgi:hypothetical protein